MTRERPARASRRSGSPARLACWRNGQPLVLHRQSSRSVCRPARRSSWRRLRRERSQRDCGELRGHGHDTRLPISTSTGRGRTATTERRGSHPRPDRAGAVHGARRAGQPADFGSGVLQLVFAPNSDELAAATQFLVQGALQQWLGDLIQVGHGRASSTTTRRCGSTVQYTIRRTAERQGRRVHAMERHTLLLLRRASAAKMSERIRADGIEYLEVVDDPLAGRRCASARCSCISWLTACSLFR